jgi:hypothetical protein
MASTTQDKLYETFVAVSGQRNSNLDGSLDSGEEIAASLSDTVRQFGELQASIAAQATGSGTTNSAGTTGGSSYFAAGATSGGGTSPAGTTSGGSPSTQDTNSSGTSTAGTTGGGITAESIVSTVLESGLGMVPLIVGLLGLFEGGGTPAPPALVRYAMPDPIYFEGADTGSDAIGADYDQMGMPRAYSAPPKGASAQASGIAAPGSSGSSATSGAPAPQITVNVQAMDSRSFLDHSSEIAQAVRDAMLNLNSINDVVNDL